MYSTTVQYSTIVQYSATVLHHGTHRSDRVTRIPLPMGWGDPCTKLCTVSCCIFLLWYVSSHGISHVVFLVFRYRTFGGSSSVLGVMLVCSPRPSCCPRSRLRSGACQQVGRNTFLLGKAMGSFSTRAAKLPVSVPFFYCRPVERSLH